MKTKEERMNEVNDELAKADMLTNNQLISAYLGCIAEFLASIADSLEEIKKAKT